MADADDCSAAAAAAVAPSELSSTREEEVASAEELNLGLTLRSSKLTRGSWMACRILTAEDLGSRSPISSSSSVSSSSPAPSPAGAGGRTLPSHHPGLVARGWPPIKTCRMNSLAIHSKDCSSEAETPIQKKINKIVEDMDSNNQERNIRPTGSMHFVKVNMDGDPIGRKVDLNVHNSYETLALSLEEMFCKSKNDRDTFTLGGGLKASQMLDGSSGFSLTYEDRDGDWMLVGDVPWGMFLITVKRLRIMRTSDAIGLAGSPRSQFRKSVGPRSIPARFQYKVVPHGM